MDPRRVVELFSVGVALTAGPAKTKFAWRFASGGNFYSVCMRCSLRVW
jgi:hypothetical protein